MKTMHPAVQTTAIAAQEALSGLVQEQAAEQRLDWTGPTASNAKASFLVAVS